jgi:hypothetical protein
MKKLYGILIAVLVFSYSLSAQQIPNGGFESWTDGTPDEWMTNNLPGFATPVTQSTTSRSGQSAARVEIVSFGESAYFGILTASDVPVTQRFGSLTGYFQFFPVNANNSIIIVVLMANDENYVGGGSLEISSAASAYTQFSLTIDYTAGETPNNAFIQIIVADSSENPVPGSFALFDDLEFGSVVNIPDESTLPNKFDIKQNYPNPFNPSTTIEYSVPQTGFVKIKVYDIIGNEVASLVNENQAAGYYKINFDGSNLPSGIYLTRMEAGNFVKTYKMTLLK